MELVQVDETALDGALAMDNDNETCRQTMLQKLEHVKPCEIHLEYDQKEDEEVHVIESKDMIENS